MQSDRKTVSIAVIPIRVCQNGLAYMTRARELIIRRTVRFMPGMPITSSSHYSTFANASIVPGPHVVSCSAPYFVRNRTTSACVRTITAAVFPLLLRASRSAPCASSHCNGLKARQAAKGRLAHQMCSVEMCPCRIDFSRRAWALIRLMDRST